MGKQFRDSNLDQLLLLPASLQDWLPEGHLARFVAEVVEALDLSAIYGKYEEGRLQDTIELEAIEKKRLNEGALSVWDQDPKNLTTNNEEFLRNPRKNTCCRQPGHIAAAGRLGLGISDLKQIDHRRIQLT